MTKSKLTLIVDGNWLLMSRLPIINSRYADEATMMQEVKALMIKSINIVLKTFPAIDNIIFVSDGGSWRKEFPIPKSAKTKTGEAAVYKGNREKTDDIDWTMVFNEFNKFILDMRENGVAAFNEPGIEGDDWCWYWSTKLNEEGTNVIIWTEDRDITQLCNSNNDGCFTIVWNKRHGVMMKKDDDLTKFLLNPYFHANEAILNDIINHATGKEEVYPDRVRIDKIIRGDAGDNIMPIVTRMGKTGDRVYRPTEKQLPESLDIYSVDDIMTYIDDLLTSKQWLGKAQEDRDSIIEHFIYNRRMVVLDKSSYPDDILNTFKKYDTWFDEHDICGDVNKVEATVLAQKNSIQSILDEI